MEIRHNSGEAGAAHFQRFEQTRGVGVEYLEPHAVNGSELFVYHAGVAAGVLEEGESAGLGELFEHGGSHNALIGIGTLVDAEIDVAYRFDRPVDIFKKHAVVLIFRRESVRDKHIGIDALLNEGFRLLYLRIEVVRDMTRGDDRDIFRRMPHDKMQQLEPLLEREEKNLARLADGENSVNLLLRIPVYERFDRRIVYFIVLCKRRYHRRIDAVRNRIFHFLSLRKSV